VVKTALVAVMQSGGCGVSVCVCCQETPMRPMGAQHAARERNGTFLAGSANQGEAVGAGADGLCRGWAEAGQLQLQQRLPICGFEACRGTMACSSQMAAPALRRSLMSATPETS
jgi:hypothetical protein